MFIHIHCHSYLLTSPGSLLKTTESGKPLKIRHFQRFLFLHKPQKSAYLSTLRCKNRE